MDFQSNLGFGAEDALKTLKLLDAGFSRFTANLEAAAKATGNFNSAHGGMESTLVSISKAASSTVKELLALANAEAKVAQQAKKNKDLSNLTSQLDARRKALQISKQLTDQLGVDRGNAPVQKLVNFDSAISEFQRLVATSNTSSSQIQRILGNLSGSYTGNERKIRDSIVSIIKAQQQLGGQGNLQTANFLLKQLGQTGATSGQQITKGLQSATQASNGLFLSWQSVTRIFVGQTIFRAISALTSEISNSVERAKELQILFAQIRTIAPDDLKVGGDKAVGDITRQLSNDFGVDQADAARAVYEAFSNQVGSTAETIDFLNETTKLSIATMSDQASTARVVSSVLKGYGLEAEQTSKVTDLLFRTIDLSAAKMEEFTGSIGRAIPLTKTLGVSLEEFFAGFATLNIQGVDTDTAITQLTNVMKGLIKPSEALRDRFREIGVASAEIGVAQFGGLVGFLQEITKTSSGLNALGGMFDDIRELQGVLGLLNNDSEIFINNFQQMGEVAEANSKAFKLVNETGAQALNRSIQEFRNVITETLGNDLIDVLNGVVSGFGGAENAAKAFVTLMEGSLPVITALVGGQLVKSIGSATAGLISFASAGTLALGPLAGIAAFAGFAAVGGGLVFLISELNEAYDQASQLEQQFKATEKAVSDLNKAKVIEEQRANADANKLTKKTVQDLLGGLAEQRQGMLGIIAEAERMEKAITDNLRDQVGEREKLVDQFLKKTEDSISKSTDRINKIGDKLKDFELKFSDDRFDRNLKAAGDDISKKSALLQSRIAEFRKLSQSAAKAGNFDDAAAFNDEAIQRAKQLADLPKQRASAEGLLNQLLKERQGLAKTEIASETQKAAALAKLQPALEAQATRIKELVSQYDALSKAVDKAKPGTGKEEAAKNLDQVAKQLQEELVKFAEKAPKGVADNLIEQLKRTFTTLDKQEVTLDFLTSDSLSRVQEQLDKRRFSADLELKVTEITGLEAGAGQADALATKIQQLQQEIIKQRAKAEGQSGSAASANTAANNITQTFETLNKQIDLLKQGFSGGVVNSLATIVGEGLSFNGVIEGVTKEREAAADRFKTELQTFQSQVNEAVGNADFTKLKELQTKLTGFLAENKDNQSFSQVIQQLTTLNDQITKFADASATSLEKLDASKAAEAATQALEKLGELFPQLESNTQKAQEQNTTLQNMGASATTGAQTAIGQLTALQTAIASATQAQLALNAAMAQQGSGGGEAQTAARGGMIHYRAMGGFIPKGTDTVPAMLSPGEFVINAAATRKFYSELVAINSGRSPVYREQGGIVNNTFGDMNINLPAGSTDVQARAFMKKVQRELRRGSSRL